ncbi:hypothetical protein EMIT0357P_60276 [Pseudomonas marginalis]
MFLFLTEQTPEKLLSGRQHWRSQVQPRIAQSTFLGSKVRPQAVLPGRRQEVESHQVFREFS